MRYVQPLTKEHHDLLENTRQEDASFRARSRAPSLFLSAHGTTLKDIAKTSQVHRVTVSAWITHWEHPGAQSWHDKPRSGRPRTLSPEERAIALHYIKEEPHCLKGVVERVAAQTDKRRSLSSLKRLATKARLRWQRVSTALKSRRDPDACAKAKRERAALQHQEDQGKIALYYCDASGFALDPTIP